MVCVYSPTIYDLQYNPKYNIADFAFYGLYLIVPPIYPRQVASPIDPVPV
jgi:hypothetical protein